MFRACLTSLTRGSSGANSGESGGGEDTPAQPSPYTRRALNEQLRQAAEAGDTNTVAHVLAHGANPRMRCSRAGLTVLHYAVFGNHVAVAQTLLAWCLRADTADGRSFDIANARDAVRFLRQRTVVGSPQGPLSWCVYTVVGQDAAALCCVAGRRNHGSSPPATRREDRHTGPSAWRAACLYCSRSAL